MDWTHLKWDCGPGSKNMFLPSCVKKSHKPVQWFDSITYDGSQFQIAWHPVTGGDIERVSNMFQNQNVTTVEWNKSMWVICFFSSYKQFLNLEPWDPKSCTFRTFLSQCQWIFTSSPCWICGHSSQCKVWLSLQAHALLLRMCFIQVQQARSILK